MRFTRPRVIKTVLLLLLAGHWLSSAIAQEFVWAPDFPVGAQIPAISAPDQNGTMRSFDDLKGENGLVLVLSRSFDWCPYCTAQLIQLTEIQDTFAGMGLGVATLTYDPVDLLKEVEEDQGIEFALLHDENIQHINAFGLRNTDYEPGDRGYGIPYPGIFLIDTTGIIRHKFAEESYRVRPDFADVLEAAAGM